MPEKPDANSIVDLDAEFLVNMDVDMGVSMDVDMDVGMAVGTDVDMDVGMDVDMVVRGAGSSHKSATRRVPISSDAIAQRWQPLSPLSHFVPPSGLPNN